MDERIDRRADVNERGGVSYSDLPLEDLIRAANNERRHGVAIIDPEDRIVLANDNLVEEYPEFRFDGRPRYRDWARHNFDKMTLVPPDADIEGQLDTIDLHRSARKQSLVYRAQKSGGILIGDHIRRADNYQVNRRRIVRLEEVESSSIAPIIRMLTASFRQTKVPFCVVDRRCQIINQNTSMSRSLQSADFPLRDSILGLVADDPKQSAALRKKVTTAVALGLSGSVRLGHESEGALLRLTPTILPTLEGFERIVVIHAVGVGSDAPASTALSNLLGVSDREANCAIMYAHGLTMQAIASRLQISAQAVSVALLSVGSELRTLVGHDLRRALTSLFKFLDLRV